MLFISCNNEDIATIVAENLEKAGIKLKLNSQEMSAWQTKIMYDKNFSITMLAGYQGPDVSGIDNRVKTVGSVNIAGYKNPHLDEVLGKADQYSEVKDRKQYYDEVQKILSEDLPMIFIIENGYKTPIKAEFEGTPYQDKTQASNEFTHVKKKGGQ